MWVFLILVYGICKGLREPLKKRATEKNGVFAVLFFYSLISFIFVIPFSRNFFELNFAYHVAIFVKSFVIFIAWICAFHSIKKLPLSIYGIVDTCNLRNNYCQSKIQKGNRWTKAEKNRIYLSFDFLCIKCRIRYNG